MSSDGQVDSRDLVAAGDRSPVSLVMIAMLLAAVAGFVDAVVFLHVAGVFPANQSGNIVFLGLSIPGESPAPLWAPPVAIAGFMVGAAIGRRSSSRATRRRGPATLLGLELVLLSAAAITLVAVGANGTLDRPAVQAVVLVVAALAMGLQTDVIRSVADVGVSTTYESGAIARIAATIGVLSDGRERGSGQRLLAVLSSVLAAYIGGAALGASRLGDHGTGLLVPVVVIAGLFVVACNRPWS